MKHSTSMKHPCKANGGGNAARGRSRTSARTQGAKCRGARVVRGLVNGVVGGPVNSPEPGAKPGAKSAGKMAYAKPGARSAERTANRA